MADNSSLFQGRLIRLAAYDPDDAYIIRGWSDNSEYMRMVDTEAARPLTLDHVIGQTGLTGPNGFFFSVRALSGDRLVGFVVIHSIEWNNGAGTLSMGIGDPADWGKGYGSDILRVILRYAFSELNLHRLSLDVIASNLRAVRAYQRAGFREEGRMREAVHRDGERIDRILMGILRHEWEPVQA